MNLETKEIYLLGLGKLPANKTSYFLLHLSYYLDLVVTVSNQM